MAGESDLQLSRSGSGAGRVAVLVMLAVGIAAASFAWWWNYNRGRRSLELYQAEGANLVRTAPKVEILASDRHDNIDISKAPGLLNARTSLLNDSSYEWPAETSIFGSPQAAVRFSNRDESLIVLFDFENRRMLVNCRTVRIKQKTAEGWQSYLTRQIEAAAR